MNKAYTLLELIVTVVIMGILIAAVLPYVSSYTDWSRRTIDMRSLVLSNDAINRSRFSSPNNPVYIGLNDVAQNTAVLNFLNAGDTTTIIEGDTFIKKNANVGGANYFSYGVGENFQFYDFSSSGILLGTFVVPSN